MFTVKLRRYPMALLANTLDRISPGNVPNHAQFKAWDALVTKMVELNKDFTLKFDALVVEKRSFATEVIARPELKDLPKDQLANIVNTEAAVKFKEQNEELDKLGEEVVTFEIDDTARSFVQMNYDTIVFPGLAQLNASRTTIIEIAEQFLESQPPTEAGNPPAELAEEAKV